MAGRGGANGVGVVGRGDGDCDGEGEGRADAETMFDQAHAPAAQQQLSSRAHVGLGNLNRPFDQAPTQQSYHTPSDHRPSPGHQIQQEQQQVQVQVQLRTQVRPDTKHNRDQHSSGQEGQGQGHDQDQDPDQDPDQEQSRRHHHMHQRHQQLSDGHTQTQPRTQIQRGGHRSPIQHHVHVHFEHFQNMDRLMLPHVEPEPEHPQDQQPRHDLQQYQHHHQHHQRQRLRQGSLASDWRFPSTPASMHSHPHPLPHPQSLRSPRSPRSPYAFQQEQHRPAAATSTSPHSQTTPIATAQTHGHDPGTARDWQTVAVSSAASPSSPSPRRRRDHQLRQNTDPLVYHRLISSDPVHSTRTPSQQTQDTQTDLPAQEQHNPASSSQTHLQHRPFLSAASPGIALTSLDRQPLQNGPVRCDADPDQAFPTVDAPQSSPTEPHETPRSNDARYDRQFLPITPVSPTTAVGPRWDSLTPRSDPSAYAQPATGAGLATTPTTDALVTPISSKFPPTPLRSPRSPSFPTGQYSHPIPEEGTVEQDYDPSDASRYEQAGPLTTMSGQVDRMLRPDSRQSGNTAYSAMSADDYNFSRPRKPSIRSLNRPDFSSHMHLRPSTAKSTASDSLRLESRTMTSGNSYAPYQPYIPSRPRRRPSDGSNMSASTFTSVTPSLRQQPSEDRLGGPGRNASQNAANGPFIGLPHTVHPQGPPRYYNRGGPPAQIQQSHLYEDEMRSSIRSHLTTSTAQETLFSEPERSSLMTKTSSVVSSSFRNTRQSSFFGPHNPSLDVRDSLSVDDVMGMYENGFDDTEFDPARRMSGIEMEPLPEVPARHLAPRPGTGDHDDSRPGSAMSHNSEAASRLLEAMSQTSPMPIPGRSFPLNGDGTKHLRDTNAFFRKSLASSLPKDMRLSFISTRSRMDGGESDDEADGTFETDSARHSRHDSGKLVGERSDEDLPIEFSEKHDEFISTISDAQILPDKERLSPQPPMVQPVYLAQPAPTQPVQGAAQPEDLDPDANDRYGFRKSNQYITREQYDDWNGEYTEYLARRRRKWEMFLKENGLMTDRPNRFPQHSAKAKRFIRKGIPPDWRGAAWFYYAGGPKILANNQGVYDDMVKRATSGQLKEVCRDDIERDLYRTFPDNVRFRRKATAPAAGQGSSDATPAHSRNNSTQSANPSPRAPGSEPEIIDQLRRVLSAFAIFNPNIGYCQSLNFLGGMLLLFVETEEQAFWLLNIITRVYLPGTHEMNLEGSKVDLSVLMAELQEVLPSVWTKISDDGVTAVKKKSRRHRHKGPPNTGDLPPVTLALTAWFMSCFIGTLPIETTLRVWDVFFYEGSKTLFRVALAIFKAGEPEIKAINDPMEVFAVVQSLPRKMLDANTLMETCFRRRSGLNHLTSELIDEQRAERKEQLQVERRAAMAAAAATPGMQTAATISIGRKETDTLTVDDGVRRKHTLFSRSRAHKERGLTDV